jgi:hypothetical protein
MPESKEVVETLNDPLGKKFDASPEVLKNLSSRRYPRESDVLREVTCSLRMVERAQSVQKTCFPADAKYELDADDGRKNRPDHEKAVPYEPPRVFGGTPVPSLDIVLQSLEPVLGTLIEVRHWVVV